MNYVILDMEWDGAYHPLHKRFVNQILQIGAVKLNEKLDIVDIFDVIIRSSISKRVSGRFSELTGITKEIMRNGISLEAAVKQYNEWLGSDTVTITWSNSDLYTIIENQKYLLKNIDFKIEKYLDLQKYIQGEMKILGHECKSQIALNHAAEVLGITTDGYDLHNAKDDSLLCAALLKKYYCQERFIGYLKDATNPDFFERLAFKSYYLSSINDKLIDKSILEFNCEKCGDKMKRISKWRFHNNSFTANFICNTCEKKFICRVRFKKTFDDLIVSRKVLEPKVKVNAIKERSDAVQSMSTTL